MSGVVDFIFGEQDNTTGIEYQADDNARRQGFVEEANALARQDVLDIYPRGQEDLQQGYRAAIDVARRAPQAETRVLQNTSQRAQETLLAGQEEYRRAIMGLPSARNFNNYYDNPLGLKPLTLGASVGPMNPFTEAQRPVFLGTPEEDRQEEAQFEQRPEQTREPVRYDFRTKQFTGGANSGTDATSSPYQFVGWPSLFNSALQGSLTSGGWL